MAITVIAFLGLLLAVAALRIVELQISKRHQRQIVADGGAKVTDPKFLWMVLLHTAVLIGAAVEVVFLRRSFIPWLAAISFVLFLVANIIRWWVILALVEHWSVEVNDVSERLAQRPRDFYHRRRFRPRTLHGVALFRTRSASVCRWSPRRAVKRSL